MYTCDKISLFSYNAWTSNGVYEFQIIPLNIVKLKANEYNTILSSRGILY